MPLGNLEGLNLRLLLWGGKIPAQKEKTPETLLEVRGVLSINQEGVI